MTLDPQSIRHILWQYLGGDGRYEAITAAVKDILALSASQPKLPTSIEARLLATLQAYLAGPLHQGALHIGLADAQMLTAALASRQSVAGELERAKQEALEGVNLGIATGIEMTEARALVAEAEVRRKDAALEPFAAVADEYHDSDDDHHEVWMDAGPQRLIRSTFELRKFRAARAALQPATIADQGEG